MYSFPFTTLDSQHEQLFSSEEGQWFDPNDLLASFGLEDPCGGIGLEFFDQLEAPKEFPVELSNIQSYSFDAVEENSFMNDLFAPTMYVPQESSYASKEEDSPLMPRANQRMPVAKPSKVEKNANSKRTRPMNDDSMIEVQSSAPKRTKGKYMEPFPDHRVVHWKYVLYNLLVEHYNSDDKNTLAVPCEVTKSGKSLKGFSLNQAHDPKKRLAELYSLYVRKEDLASEDYSSPFIQDLYKYYLRCALQLMNKFFIKAGPWTYLYDEVILFVPEEDLNAAEMRLRFLEGKRKRKGGMD